MQRSIIRVALAVCLVGLGASATWLLQAAPGVVEAAQRPTPRPAEVGDLSPDERINIDVYQKANRSVVNITTRIRTEDLFFFTEYEQEGSGSGCVLDRDGHIITNNHVVEDAARSGGNIVVTLFDATAYQARVIGTDPPNDLAVLKIAAPADKLFPVDLGDSSNLQVGLRVFVIGNPFGFDRTLTTGIISALNRELPVDQVRSIKGIIQTDAAINPGNSGGPLLDKHARLIGMNTAIASTARQHSGVGFAIPVNNIKRIVPQLIRHGRVIRADIGIAWVAEIEGTGLQIRRLVRGGAAGRAGLRGPRAVVQRTGRGDYRYVDPSKADIIVAIDGNRVDKAEELLAYVESKKPGDTVKVTFLRDGEYFELDVTLGESE